MIVWRRGGPDRLDTGAAHCSSPPTRAMKEGAMRCPACHGHTEPWDYSSVYFGGDPPEVYVCHYCVGTGEVSFWRWLLARVGLW